MERDFKGVWIPKEIWLSEKLTLQEKLCLVEIDSLDNNEGCFASNAYFAEFFNLSKNRCSEVIKSLEKKKLISISYIKEEGKKNIEKRIIRVLEKPNRGIREIDKPIRDVEGEYSGKGEDNNTLVTNTSNNTIIKQHYADNVTLTEEEYNKLINEYGKSLITDKIEDLDLWKGSKGKKTKSDYMTIRQWIKRDSKDNKPKEQRSNAGAYKMI